MNYLMVLSSCGRTIEPILEESFEERLEDKLEDNLAPFLFLNILLFLKNHYTRDYKQERKPYYL